ncbi:beta-propeller domain-containing protein [Sorangium sp. So ce394]|uniref:beta-propeller domain-containing protein n=1 Tax=Sorangium sp. So ce394 TaxID=3133310 RepID=UPI003F5BE9BA
MARGRATVDGRTWRLAGAAILAGSAVAAAACGARVAERGAVAPAASASAPPAAVASGPLPQPRPVAPRRDLDYGAGPPRWQCSPELVAQLEAPLPPPRVDRPAGAGVAPSTRGCAEHAPRLREGALRAADHRLEASRREYLRLQCTPPRLVPVSEKGWAARQSGTNVQVPGVDEPDFVKLDGPRLYTLSGTKLRIFDVAAPARARPVGEATLDGPARKLFAAGNRLVVYSSMDPPAGRAATPECTYGYDCVPAGDGAATRISVLDVSRPGAPKTLRTIDVSGSFIAARRVGDAVHTVVHDDRIGPPGLRFSPERELAGPEDAEREFARLREENRRAILAADPSVFLPTAREAGQPGAGACRIHVAPGADAAGFTSIISLDLGASSGFHREIVQTQPGFTYASKDALYLAVPQLARRDLYPDWAHTGDTLIHAFDFAGGASTYAASGVVRGRLLNQFSMDEHEGHLRVATTVGRAPDPAAHSLVSVLRRQRAELATVGVLDRLAPSEDIRSVRFDGARGFVVTFKKTDPLFALDLSQPTAPRVLAELKIPGFSTYMHLMDPEHLLTIGYDAEDQGKFAYFQGVLLQIFDVQKPSEPRLLHRAVIGTRGSSSEALTNHLAFTYFAPKELLSLPMTICEGGQGPQHGTSQFSGLLLYRASAQRGFQPLGRVAQGQAFCGAWWSSASSAVKRSFVTGDHVLSVSDQEVKVRRIQAPSKELVTLTMQ